MTPLAARKILIISGEPSGDLYAANLVKDLKSLDPSLSFFGIGGDLSRKAGIDVVFDITKLALIGLTEVIKHASVIKSAHDAVIQRCERDRPDMAILVDYPGFNLKIANDLSRKGIPVVYYISPQIWAWGRQRIHVIKRCVKKMIVFFRFEEEMYKGYGVDAECVGHPLVDVVKVTVPKTEVLKKYSLSPAKRTIALLPGSRESEIVSLLPAMAGAASIIAKKLGNVQFIVSKRPDRPASIYEDILNGRSIDYRLVEGDMHNIAGASDFAVVASGTATLEVGMIGTPYVLVYTTSLLTFIAYRLVADMHLLGLVNIISGRKIVPELLMYDMTPERIAAEVVGALISPEKIGQMRRDLAAVKSSLGTGGASMRAAKIILPLLK